MRGLVVAAAAALAAIGACSGEEPRRAAPPPERTTTGEQNPKPRSAYPPARRISVPDGYRAEVYASGLLQPTAMAYGPAGRLYVAQNDGRIVIVRPRTKRPMTFAAGFAVPLGVAWRGRTLYVSAQGALYRLALTKRGRASQARTLVSGLPYELHQQDNVVLGRDGRLYLGSGSTCDACEEADPRSAAILSVRPDGSDLEVVARGLRNPFGLAVDPETGLLWASVNGRDDLGEWNPAESVVRVRKGADYGWPGCWPNWRTRRMAGECAGVTPHDVYLEPHSSPGGMAFWNGALYVAEWGEYNAELHGRKVVRVDVETREARAFADGFEHPLAVAVDPENALLVADWGRGVIYRIQRRGEP
jgi:glucose/arabinose dehydrogenase